MVMKAEPWGEALDALATDGRHRRARRRPAHRSRSATAERLSGEEHLVFACGRYEGIDQRVIDHAARAGGASRRSRSATSCSTAERSPRWR